MLVTIVFCLEVQRPILAHSKLPLEHWLSGYSAVPSLYGIYHSLKKLIMQIIFSTFCRYLLQKIKKCNKSYTSVGMVYKSNLWAGHGCCYVGVVLCGSGVIMRKTMCNEVTPWYITSSHKLFIFNCGSCWYQTDICHFISL